MSIPLLRQIALVIAEMSCTVFVVLADADVPPMAFAFMFGGFNWFALAFGFGVFTVTEEGSITTGGGSELQMT